MSEEITNFTYVSREEADKIICKSIREWFLRCLDISVKAMEFDTVIPLSEEQRRSLLGRIQYDITQYVNDKPVNGHVFSWSEKDEKNIVPDIKFSMDFAEQAISKMFAKDISDFDARWEILSANPNPFALNEFFRMFYFAGVNHVLSVSAQKRFMSLLEKAFIDNLSIVFSELRSRFEEWNITGVSTTVSVGPTAEDEELFNSLCDFLEGWEPSSEVLDVIGTPNRMLTPAEVLTIVSNLQKIVPKILEEALGYPDGRLSHHLKETMLKQAEDVLGLSKDKIDISTEDQEAVHMVDGVFTENLQDKKLHHASKTVLAQILFPSVKAALLNRRWFAQENHPAREFISSVSEAVAPEDGILQTDMIKKASQSVNKLVNGFNEDVSIFSVLTEEIQEFADEKKEKDWEKLVISREEIRGELRKRWGYMVVPQPVMDFALELGGEHLASLEQKGLRLSPEWEKTNTVLTQLLNLKSNLTERVKIDGLLRDSLMDMLMSCGWTGVRAHNRLAEQEDVIHAYYVLGQRDFPTVKSFPLPPKPVKRSRSMQRLQESLSASMPLDVLNTQPTQVTETFIPQPIIPVVPTDINNGFSNKFNNNSVNENNGFKLNTDSPKDINNDQIDELFSNINENLSKKHNNESNNLIINNFDLRRNEDLNSSNQVNINQSNDFIELQNNINFQPKVEEISPVKSLTNLEKIANLEIGSYVTWINAENQKLSLKLSYISPLSMKYLFVNEFGARTFVGNPKELEKMILANRLFLPE